MRSLFVVLTGASMLVACTFNATGITATSGDTADATTTGTTTTASSTTGEPQPTTGTATGGLCVPGEVSSCFCPVGTGEHTCFPDGMQYGPCDCPDPTPSSTTAVDPDTTDATTTTTLDPGTTTTGDTTSTSDTTSTTSDTTSSTSDTTSTTSDDTTTTGESSTGEPCGDSDEPNESLDTAVDHEGASCMQDAKTFQGTLGLGGDVDWHTFLGSWPEDSCAQNNVDPRFEFKLTAGDSVRLCVFFNCVFGMDPQKIEVPTCMDGAMQVDSPDDGEGCCSLNDFRVDFNCTGVDDESAQVNLRLDGGPDDECSPYTVSYDYIPKN